MILHLLARLRSACRRLDGLLWTLYGDRALPDDATIRRALAAYERGDRERRRRWTERVKR